MVGSINNFLKEHREVIPIGTRKNGEGECPLHLEFKV
jgi:hypothetical protein